MPKAVKGKDDTWSRKENQILVRAILQLADDLFGQVLEPNACHGIVEEDVVEKLKSVSEPGRGSRGSLGSALGEEAP